jgi:hypothetical protein
MERFIGSSDLERSMQSSGLTQQRTHMSIVHFLNFNVQPLTG